MALILHSSGRKLPYYSFFRIDRGPALDKLFEFHGPGVEGEYLGVQPFLELYLIRNCGRHANDLHTRAEFEELRKEQLQYRPSTPLADKVQLFYGSAISAPTGASWHKVLVRWKKILPHLIYDNNPQLPLPVLLNQMGNDPLCLLNRGDADLLQFLGQWKPSLVTLKAVHLQMSVVEASETRT